MAVAWPAPCPIAAVMAHGWLGWNGVILRGVGGWSRNNEMNERTAPYNQKTRGGVFLISQYWDKRASFIHGTKSDSLGPAVINCATTLYFYSEHVAGSTVHTYTKIRKKTGH